jgi:uncharacterized membrane protein YsdA (DUF1294 family)
VANSSRPTRGEPRKEAWSRFGPWRFALWLPLAFLLLLGLEAWLRRLPPAIPIAYLAGSLLTYAAYAYDKRQARRDEWRTPEATLHLLDLLGGWPGGWIARRQFRHKTAKLSFRAIFWLCIALHLFLWCWIFGAVPAHAAFFPFVGAVWNSAISAFHK